MKKLLFLVLALVLTGINNQSRAQAPEWTRLLQTNTFGSSNMNAVHSDSAYIYVAGTISGPVTFESVNFNPVGLRDLLLTRIDKSGITSWVKQFPAGPNSTITPQAVTSDADGNIYVYSRFSGTVIIGGNTFTSDLTNNSFLAKFDPDGNDLWSSSVLATSNGSSKIVLDDLGNSYLQSSTSKLLKFDSSGNVLWEQSYLPGTLQSIAISGNNLFVAGALKDVSTTFGSITLNSLGGYNTGYLLKADLDGVYTNSLVVGGSSTADGSSVSSIISDNSGNLFITGAYTENLILGAFTIPNTAANFNNYTYIAKCDTSLDFSWVKSSTQFNNPNRDMFSYRIYSDLPGNLYQYGFNSSSFQFDAVTVNPNNLRFLAKFDSDGNIIDANPLDNITSGSFNVTPEGKLVHVGSLFVIQYLGNFSSEWEKSSTNTDQSGTIAYRYIRHDNSGNTFLQSTVTGYVDFYGTIIDTDIPLTLISKHDISGNLLWLEQIPDKPVENFGPAFVVDDNNNVFTIGLFKDTLMIGATQLTSLNTGDEGYVAKYNSDGVLQWASVFGMGTNVYVSVTLAVDNSGNAIVAGVQGPANFLLKYDPSGNKLWEKSFPMDSYYIALVDADSSGNIYLASELHLSDGTGSATIGSVTLNQTYDDGATALIKFDPDGNALWAKTYGGVTGSGNSNGWPVDIETDAEGNTYLYGWAVNNAVFGAYTLTNPIGSSWAFFLTKINTAGDVDWATAVYEKSYSFNYGDLLDLDESGNIYLGGDFKDIIEIEGNQFSPQSVTDFFLAKFNNSGSFEWIKSLPVGSAGAINALAPVANDVISIAGSSGSLMSIGSFTIYKKSGSSAIIATLGALSTQLTTSVISGISATTSISGGEIISEGLAPVTSRGVCWSTSPNPDISGFKTVDGSGSGFFSSALNGLVPNTNYYVRAYATNNSGTFYGDELTFTTDIANSISHPFFDQVDYIGAFDGVNDWTSGWTDWTPESTDYPAPVVTKGNGNFTFSGGLHVTADETWSGTVLLDGWVYVDENTVLTILPGTVIRATAQSALIIQKGAKIMAEGNSVNPIVFTSNQEPGSRSIGDWAGLILCGKAINNIDGVTGFAEGGIGSEHGGYDYTDNSGVIKYTRIEFTGYDITGTGNEINALTMLSVGSGTLIDYVQVSYAGDDGFEWFGGSVKAKHLISYKTEDDDLDSESGYTGMSQFVVIVRDSTIVDTDAANGIESDNNAFGSFKFPLTSSIISNLSAFGPSATNVSPITLPLNHNQGSALRLRRNTRTSVYNSLFMGFGIGLRLESPKSWSAAASDSITIQNTILAGMRNEWFKSDVAPADEIKDWYLAPSRNNDTISLAAGAKIADPFNYTALNFQPQTGSPVFNASWWFVQSNGNDSLVTDIDGNVYTTVAIGTQTWMAENLKTTKYNDGTPIPLVTDSAEWSTLTTPAYSWYNNDQASYGTTYGALYNWYTVNTGNLCPTGWHVPSDAEWTVLTDYLGGEAVAGGKLKETGTAHWLSPNTGSTNETGFTALPGGGRGTTAEFLYLGSSSFWWSSTEYDNGIAWNRYMNYDGSSLDRDGNNKELGFSIRCLKNSEPPVLIDFPITFESPEDTSSWIVFANGVSIPSDFLIASNPDKSGKNTSDNSLKFTVNSAADPWVGAFTDSYNPVEFTAENHTLTMMVYKSVISPSGFKIEGSTNGGPNIELKVVNTTVNQWELLTFNFSDAIGYTYPRIVIFPDFPDVRTLGTTVYIDNISGPVNQLIETGNSTDTTAGINKAGSMPVIDGIIDSVWAEATKYNIIKNFNGETPTVGFENETYWKALWTDEGIYVVVHVEDNVFMPEYAGSDLTQPWMYDKVELYFDVNPVLQDGGGPNIGNGHHQVAPGFVNGQTNGTLVTSGDGVVHAFLVNGASYNAEYFIPFTKLLDKDGNQFNRFASIGFDVTVSDNDVTAPVRNRAVWQNTGSINESYVNMDDCGTLTFNDAGTFIPITSLTISPEGGNNSIEWDNGSLQMNVTVVPANASYQHLDWAITGGTGAALVDGYGLLTARKNGTETVIATTKDGTDISSSATVDVMNQFVSLSDYSIIREGSFPKEGSSFYPWEWWTDNGGTAFVKAGVLNVIPAQVGNIWQMQVTQKNWTAYQDSSYVLSFTAWSDVARTFVADIEDLGNNYVRPGSSSDPESINGRSEWTVSVSPTTPRRFTFHTTMDSVKANTLFSLVIQASNDINPVFIDDISLVPASSLTQLDELPAPTAAVIKKATLAPVIDGSVDTIWNHANTYTIDRKFTGENPTLGAPGATTWKALWTNQGIYVLLQVSDDVFLPPYAGTDSSASWNYDRPELYFDVNPVKRDGKGAGWFMGHYQVAPAFISGQVNGTQFTDGEGVVHAFNVSGTDYTAEYFIPYTKLLDQSGNMVKKTDSIGFDVTINDRDNELKSRQRAVWTNFGALGESWYNLDGAGIIILEGATNDVSVSGITIASAGNDSTITTEMGTLQFTASVLPANSTNQMVTWTVSNGTGKAKISEDGLLTALADGTVTVMATSTDGTNISGSKVITISNQGIYSTLVYSLIGTAFYKADGVTPGSWDYDIDLTYNGTSGNVSSYVLENQQILQDGEFKIRKDYQWSESWGPDEMQLVGDPSNFIKATGGPNFKAINEKVYDITFMVDWTNKSYRLLMYDGSQYLITSKPDSVLTSSAVINAEVVTEGANPVLSRGVCWNTAPMPVVGDFSSENGSGIGAFSIKLTGLELKTLYFARSYAITSSDTIYGNEVFFRTVEFIDYTSVLDYFHPTAGGSYPDFPYIADKTADKTLKFIDSTLAETWFAIWDDELCRIHINWDNSVWIEVTDSWPYPVIQGDPNDASKVSYYDPATGKIYLYYYYFGTGGNRIFWEVLSPPPPPTAPESLIVSSPYIPLKVESGTYVAWLVPGDVNKQDTLTMELVDGFGDNAMFDLYYDLLVLNSGIDLLNPEEYNIKVKVTDNAGLSTEFEKVIYASSKDYEIQSVVSNDYVRIINEISVINDRNIWIQDGFDRVASTNDGGETWKIHSVPSAAAGNYGPMFAIDSLTAWLLISVGDPAIYRTVNGGNSWVRQTAYGASSFPDIVYFWNKNEGFTMGDVDDQGYIEIYTTTNGGVNWVRVPETDVDADMLSTVNTQSILSVYQDTVWVSGNDGLIFRSPDKGHTWEAFQSPVTNQSTILFINGREGIISPIFGQDNYITQDGGESWTLSDWLAQDRSNYSYISQIPGTNYIALSNNDELYFSNDLGNTWLNADIMLPQIYDLQAVNGKLLWAGGSLDRMYKINLANLLPCDSEFSFSLNNETGQTSFTSMSAGEASYNWDFGDGSFSSEANPTHTYKKAGNYQVCLSVYNSITECQSISCNNVVYLPEGETFITANFEYFTDSTDLTVSFNDLSTSNTTDWYWTMGDGKVLTTQNPVYTYSKPGTYNICLTAIDKNNLLLQSVCREITVGEITCTVSSDFSFFINPEELKVTFTEQTDGDITDYYWSFGDGNTSTLANPVYSYSSAGYYLVGLSVRNSVNGCMDVSAQYIQVGSVDCRAGFTFGVDPVSNTVSFKDDSKGEIDFYYWDFGDGTFSVQQNPDKLYKKEGIFLAGQTVIDNENGCIDLFYQPVQVGEVDCSADFESYIDASTNTGYFTNKNVGESTALLWSFGDGRFSVNDNPVHVFPSSGIYSVGLNTYDFNSGCMDYYEEALLIGELGNDCEADFIYILDPSTPEVTFKNKSIGDVVGSVWNFGDGSENSEDTDPVHTFTKGGYQYVCLNIITSQGVRNMTCKWVMVAGSAADDCRADFMFSVDSADRKVTFVDKSFGDIDKYTWDFGDSGTDSVSILKDPIHTYDEKGYYLVKLTVENTGSGCISSEYKLLNVAESQVLKAAFGYEAKDPDKKLSGYPVDMVSASSGDGATVEWDFGDKQIKKDAGFTVMDSTSGKVTHYYQLPGKYRVCLRISDPASGQTDEYCNYVFTKFAVNINDAVSHSGLTLDVYPNPLIDNTTINYTLPESQYVEIAIFDQLGRRIETLEKSRKETGNYQIIWDAQTHVSGVYHLKLITQDKIITKQLVITR